MSTTTRKEVGETVISHREVIEALRAAGHDVPESTECRLVGRRVEVEHHTYATVALSELHVRWDMPIAALDSHEGGVSEESNAKA